MSEEGRDLEVGRRHADPLPQPAEVIAASTAGTPTMKTLTDAAGIDRSTASAYDALLERLLITEQIPSWTSGRLNRPMGLSEGSHTRRRRIQSDLLATRPRPPRNCRHASRPGTSMTLKSAVGQVTARAPRPVHVGSCPLLPGLAIQQSQHAADDIAGLLILPAIGLR
jgi:hypothetical protein